MRVKGALGRILGSLLPNPWVKRIVRAAGVVFLIQVVAAPLSYLLQVVIARVLGSDGYGTYTFLMAWAILLALPVGLGFTTALVRFVPEYSSQSAKDLLRGVARRAWQLVPAVGVGLAVVASLLVVVSGQSIDGISRVALLAAIWIVPADAVLSVQASMARGFDRMILAYLPGKVIRPVVVIILILGLSWLGRAQITAVHALGCMLVATIIALSVQAAPLIGELSDRVGSASPTYKTKYWLRVSVPMLLIAGFSLLLDRTDVIMLGILRESREVGLYNAAARTAKVTTFVLFAVNAIAGPAIATVYQEDDRSRLQELAETVVQIVFWPSAVIVLGLIVFSPIILNLFGTEFTGATEILGILAVAHLINVGAGSVGYLMNMTGHQDEMARIIGVVAVANIVFNAVAIPVLGALGAALATGVSVVIWNIWLNRRVVSRLSIEPSIVTAVLRMVGRRGPAK